MKAIEDIVELLERKIAAGQNLQNKYAEMAKLAFWSYGDDAAKLNRDRFNDQRNQTDALKEILREIKE